MTETFLDRQAVRTLATDCKIIADSSAELLRIARLETSPPGGRTARNPRVPGSRPPLNIGALSVANEIHTCLMEWSRYLKESAAVDLPEHDDDRTLALHLGVHVHRIAQQSWSQDCADEIGTWAATILALTTPPPSRRIDEYSTAQRAEGLATAQVSAEMCADLVEEYTRGEHRPSAQQIRKWGQREKVAVYGPPGCRMYAVREVIDHMRHAKRRK
ncbi:DUF7341 domain-containing protein [Dietzia alimentaria]|uniref:DUF7341 domain-containing protein n=1 Tax=Dietzia alimentaria TaxID=665550 RepID=UPI00029B36D3|nr:hypothetical protein [Dietzia alimentaria]